MTQFRGSYILFAHNDFYPEGAADDYVGRFETLESAVDYAKSMDYNKDRASSWEYIYGFRYLDIYNIDNDSFLQYKRVNEYSELDEGEVLEYESLERLR